MGHVEGTPLTAIGHLDFEGEGREGIRLIDSRSSSSSGVTT